MIQSGKLIIYGLSLQFIKLEYKQKVQKNGIRPFNPLSKVIYSIIRIIEIKLNGFVLLM